MVLGCRLHAPSGFTFDSSAAVTILAVARPSVKWRRADLAMGAKLAERKEPAAKQFVRRQLGHWLEDTDLVAVRDKETLDKLPDGERQEWRRLWDDIAALPR